MTDPGHRLFALLLWLYPRAFRERYRADLHAFFDQDRGHPKYRTGPLRPLRFWIATIRDALRAALGHRREARDAAAPAPPPPPSSGRWRRDVRFAWRGLWSSPGVTFAALAVLIIGIGASTAIFSVVDAVILRGLPYPDDDRLVYVSGTIDGRPISVVRPQDYFEYRQRQRVFTQIGATTGAGRFTTIDEPVESFNATRLTASIFDVFGVVPALGRPFREADERPGAPPVAILSDALWRSRFGTDPRVIGRRIALKTGDVQVVGIMGPEFRYPVSTSSDFWLPYAPAPSETVRGKGRIYKMTVIGRLAPGVTVEQAAAQLAAVQETLRAEDPAWFEDHDVAVRAWRDALLNDDVRSWMLLLLGAVAGVLLIACLNVANLLVARAVARGPELALRTALGAGRWVLARTLMLESLMLSVAGAAGGILLAYWSVDLLRANLPASVPRLATIAVDLRVIGVAVAAAVGTGLVFGLLPALQVTRPDLMTLVSRGGRSHSGGRASRQIRTGLVIGEVAIASVLLVGSAMFMASFMRVASIDLGFEPRHVMALTGAIADSRGIRPATTPDREADARSGQTRVADALTRLRAVPGVLEAAAVGGGRPLGGTRMSVEMQPVGIDRDFSNAPSPHVWSVTPGYLDAVRGSLVRGRWIADTDVLGSEPVIVLSEETARVYFGGQDPLGQRVRIEGDAAQDEGYQRTVIGIVAPMRFRGPEHDVGPEVFVPLAQGSYATAEILVRTEPDPLSLVPALHAAVRSAMPDATPVTYPLEQDYARLLAQRKFNMVVLAIFGIVAIVVAALGIYGLMAYVVEQRRREIGVRVALGADPAGILRMVLGGATVLLVTGLAAGVGASALLERLVRAFLFEPQPHDPVVYGTAVLALLLAGLAAAFGPARRAARVDPLIALRSE